jgi:anti-sigma factor RsiW
VNCKEFQECACDAVDKRLESDRAQELIQHAAHCPHCQYELNALRLAKEVVHDKIPLRSVPAEVYYAIVNKTFASPRFSWLSGWFGMKLNLAGAFVIVAAVAIGIYSLFIPSSGIPDDSNIIHQSLNNYQAVIGGSIKPQLVSNHENVRSFLEKEVNFAVNVPNMKGCNSCAGVLSNFKGVKLAHVVYQIGSTVVYIYQADMNEAMKGDKIGLPAEAKKELLDTDWYIKEVSDDRTIVLWRYENTLCAAVSSMKKDQLVALLTEKDAQ